MAVSSTSIQPGEVRNPTGRPKKGDAMADIFKIYSERKYDLYRTYHEAVIDALYELAIVKKDVHAVRYVLDRLHGKIPETLSASVQGDVQISILDFSKMIQREAA